MVDESFWEPLPSLEDLISGNFKRSQKKRKQEIVDFDTVNKIKSKSEEVEEAQEYDQEDGEIEEGEIDDDDDGEIEQVKAAKPAKKVKIEQPKTANKKVKTEKVSSKNKPAQQQQQQPFVPRIVCRYFMDGVCSKGDKCTFSHAVVPNRTPEEARVREACKFFIAGSCMKDSACHFSHELSKFPCKFFHLRGECSAAAKGCRFSHAPISSEELEKLRASETERINEKERAVQALNALKSSSSASSFESTTETRNQPEKAAAKNEQMTLHPSLVNPFADVDDL